MSVSSIFGSNAVSITKSIQKTTTTDISAPAKTASSTADSSGIKTYDFTNITPQNMLATMNGLIKSGKMSLDEASSLVGMIPSPLSKVNYDSKMPDSYSQPMDFMAALKQSYTSGMQTGNTNSAAYATKALDALTRLQGTTSSADIFA